MTEALQLSPRLKASIHDLVAASSANEPVFEQLSVFFQETSLLALNRLGDAERLIRQEINSAEFGRANLHRRRQHDVSRFAVPWFDLFDGNGYLRESAVRLTRSGAPNAFLLAMLVRRLNDWVPQVRSAASSALPHVLAMSASNDINSVAWLLLSVRKSWGRLGDEQQRAIDNFLEHPGVVDALCYKIQHDVSGPLATVLRQLCRRPAADEYLPRLAARARQASVRAIAYRMLFDQQAVWQIGWEWRWLDKPLGDRHRHALLESRPIAVASDLVSTLDAAILDPSPFVRRMAGDALIKHRAKLGAQGMVFAKALADDNYPSIAERGRFAMSKFTAN